MALTHPMTDRIEASFRELALHVNATSASARAGWLFFVALQVYFFITLAGIGHRDLLLGSAVTLPLLQVDIELKWFFLYGPVILVLTHIGILMQHAMLARQTRELHERLTQFEGPGLFRSHIARLHVHPYFFAQLIAGPRRSGLFGFLLGAVAWVTLGILPALLLLNFQIAFLPYHDLQVTWAHRAYLVFDVIMLTVFVAFMRYPGAGFVTGFGRTIAERPLSFLLGMIFAVGALFFSLSVATIPDERMDRTMASLMPAPLPAHGADTGEPRQAFLLTAMLFEGGVDPVSGRPLAPFARNLIVTDTDLARGGGDAAGGAGINLRRRDLRYAVFDRSNMRGADLTAANLTQASLREVNLVEAKAEKAVFRGADLWRAKFIPDAPAVRPVTALTLRGADLRGANLVEVNLQGADLQGVLFEEADLRGSQMDASNAAEATRQGAKF